MKHFCSLIEYTGDEIVEDALQDSHGGVFVSNFSLMVEGSFVAYICSAAMASWIIIIILATALTAVFMIFKPSQHKKHKIKQVLPPGPKGLPILGCLHLLGDLPHVDLHKLSRKYGPIMHIRLGSVPTIVVSSSEAAELFLKTHDLVFASRPYIQASKYLTYRRKGIVFSEYGSYWRDIRKLCSLELLTNSKIETFRPMRKEEVANLLKFLRVRRMLGKRFV
ncbi:hypothetical protein Sjap_024401 [Stephania japonica]|uniref:Cytochrome P450 n=1 Tax=Stephania japonica TaxID=461633 RepID=A0AAP0ELZ5_9MAGN